MMIYQAGHTNALKMKLKPGIDVERNQEGEGERSAIRGSDEANVRQGLHDSTQQPQLSLKMEVGEGTVTGVGI